MLKSKKPLRVAWSTEHYLARDLTTFAFCARANVKNPRSEPRTKSQVTAKKLVAIYN